MTDLRGKRYWLVGASEGLGEALARKMSAAGAEVIVSARGAERLAEVVAGLSGPARAVAVDVADSASVRRAAAEAGPIDGVVFLAGVYWPMTAQDWDADRVEAMCDVNFTGCARVIGAVLPAMVQRGSGHVVITGSLSGFRGLAGGDRLWRKQGGRDGACGIDARRPARDRASGCRSPIRGSSAPV